MQVSVLSTQILEINVRHNSQYQQEQDALALFVRCNHHLQNVIFGQALLRDESADSFMWLFKSI
ncbi:LOW QUALITY PROTEIN: hypothetical protein U9M48_039252 [Paspalum notatum var. saurae]|uniref:Uncharacterized protein n=1 Tax=Paspalum notatum var. saurae TaxID=547442 RepID=A0AAQ3UNL3_PASNO